MTPYQFKEIIDWLHALYVVGFMILVMVSILGFKLLSKK